MELFQDSVYFGFVLTVVIYLFSVWLKKKLRCAVLAPILVSVTLIIVCLLAMGVDYDTYYEGAKYIAYMLTPSTVCLAVPLYKQLHLLKKHFAAVILAIASGVAANAITVFVLSLAFALSHEHYVSILPKSITTAIALGVCEEAGGIVQFTIICITITGVLGTVIAESLYKIVKINDPVARGLALGTACHALGTSKALELGEIEGALSSLSVAVTGLMTVIVVPFMAKLI